MISVTSSGNLKGFARDNCCSGSRGHPYWNRILSQPRIPIHDNKNALIGAIDMNTVLLNFASFSIRFWKNKRDME